MKTVGLFIPCYIDQFFPRVGMATVELLEQCGFRVEFPSGQTCCGQPMANTGCTEQTRPLAERFLNLFRPFDYVVAPSGHVELSSRPLTFDALTAMIRQVLPDDSRQALEDVGAVEREIEGIADLNDESSGRTGMRIVVKLKKDAPALVKTALSGNVIPTATTANILQTNVNTFINLGRTWLAPQSQLLAEVSYVDVSDPDARRVPGLTAGPMNSDLFFGSHGLAFQALLSSTYPGIIENWELGTTVAYSRQLKGRTILGGVGGQGDHRLSLGGTMTFKRNFQVGLTYLGYYGDANLGRLGIEKVKNFRGLTDRDQLSLTMKYSF